MTEEPNYSYLSDELSSRHITECMEDKQQVDQFKSVLITRIGQIPQYSLYGPPDMVYLVKERIETYAPTKGIFGGKKKKDNVEVLGGFHFV